MTSTARRETAVISGSSRKAMVAKAQEMLAIASRGKKGKNISERKSSGFVWANETTRQQTKLHQFYKTPWCSLKQTGINISAHGFCWCKWGLGSCSPPLLTQGNHWPQRLWIPLWHRGSGGRGYRMEEGHALKAYLEAQPKVRWSMMCDWSSYLKELLTWVRDYPKQTFHIIITRYPTKFSSLRIAGNPPN